MSEGLAFTLGILCYIVMGIIVGAVYKYLTGSFEGDDAVVIYFWWFSIIVGVIYGICKLVEWMYSFIPEGQTTRITTYPPMPKEYGYCPYCGKKKCGCGYAS